MSQITNVNFGPLVAYLVPGATVLLGLRPFSHLLQTWFASTPQDAPTLGGFLYLTVASLAAGMTVNAIRWAVIDTLHTRTGLKPPTLDFARLGPNVEAYRLLIDIHYQHYQFFSNAFVATLIAYICYRIHLGLDGPWGLPDLACVVLELIFLAASRNTLGNYYTRTEQLLRTPKRRVPRQS